MRDVDLNLLRTFVLLFETGSVSHTAELQCLTQPTVSYSLKKLRSQFKDQLFVRSTTGLVPTSMARQLFPPIQNALAAIDTAVGQAERFDPATATDSFALCLSDLGETAFLPRLHAAMESAAPGTCVQVLPLDVAKAENQLIKGEADAVICNPLLNPERITRRKLFDEDYVALASAHHPRLKSTLSLQQFTSERHIAISGETGHTAPDQALAKLNVHRRVCLRLPRFSAVANIVQSTSSIAVVPRHIAESYVQTAAVKYFDLPFEVPSVEISLYSKPEANLSAPQKWFVGLLESTLGFVPLEGQGP